VTIYLMLGREDLVQMCDLVLLRVLKEIEPIEEINMDYIFLYIIYMSIKLPLLQFNALQVII
jgi:hypothetical protein